MRRARVSQVKHRMVILFFFKVPAIGFVMIFVFFCNFRRMIASAADIKKTAKAILISKKTAIVTPNKAE